MDAADNLCFGLTSNITASRLNLPGRASLSRFRFHTLHCDIQQRDPSSRCSQHYKRAVHGKMVPEPGTRAGSFSFVLAMSLVVQNEHEIFCVPVCLEDSCARDGANLILVGWVHRRGPPRRFLYGETEKDGTSHSSVGAASIPMLGGSSSHAYVMSSNAACHALPTAVPSASRKNAGPSSGTSRPSHAENGGTRPG